MSKYVYAFEEGKKEMRNLLGGKGANLAEMTNIGMPVPRGFTITTEACTKYYDDGKNISEEIINEIFAKVAELEEKTGKCYDHYRQEACFLRCEADMAEDDYKAQQRQKVFNKKK